jgi:hypothetical protein
MVDRLRLRAEDEEDLAVLSAIMQDALVAVGDMVWLREERRFVLVANRFRRELPEDRCRRKFERQLCGVRMDGVRGVRRRGFHLREEDRLLVLLALRWRPRALFLDFAGGSSVQLEVERILCHLDDLGEPWPTRWRPSHPVDDDTI